MLESLTALVIATAVLVAIPGPNVALIVANSLRYGLGSGIATVLGTTLGIALQLCLVAVGMVAIVELAAGVLSLIKWAGVVYLVYLGIRTWREPPPDIGNVRPRRAMFWRGVLVAAMNPKTLLFNAAFLPQFVGTGAGPADVGIVAGVYLSVLLLGDSLWAAFATSARPLLHRCAGLTRRVTGAFLVAAGIGLALARKADG